MRWLMFIAVVGDLLVGTATAAVPRGGLWGVVTRGPLTPVCVVGRACYGPAADLQLVFSRKGTVAARVTTNRYGKYRVALPPGVYSVQAAAKQAIGRGLEPSRTRVFALRYVRVDFSLDTGIR